VKAFFTLACGLIWLNTCLAQVQSFDLALIGGVVPSEQRKIRVKKDDAVQINVTSDAPGELHLHAYHLSAPVVSGTPAQLSFKAYATGRFRLEWHGAGAIKTVAGNHHAQPLATLEVHPR
jgi:hypothetical protein